MKVIGLTFASFLVVFWSVICKCRSKSACDPLVPEYCGLPFPNSYFTVATKETSTSVRLNLSDEVFPSNLLGVPMDPDKWNLFGMYAYGPSYCDF